MWKSGGWLLHTNR